MFAIKFQLQDPKQLLKNCPLFAGLPAAELNRLLPCTKPKFCCYRRGELVAAWGEQIRLGIVAEGVILSTRDMDRRSSHIIEFLEQGHLFGVDAVLSCEGTCPTNLIADVNSSILFFDLLEPVEQAEPELRAHLMSNASRVLADRSVKLLYRTEVLSVKLLRNQILAFFRILQRKQGSNTIRLKLNRQQLAQYLCTNRSALSRELGWMQRDGLITIHSNRTITIAPGAIDGGA